MSGLFESASPSTLVEVLEADDIVFGLLHSDIVCDAFSGHNISTDQCP